MRQLPMQQLEPTSTNGCTLQLQFDAWRRPEPLKNVMTMKFQLSQHLSSPRSDPRSLTLRSRAARIRRAVARPLASRGFCDPGITFGSKEGGPCVRIDCFPAANRRDSSALKFIGCPRKRDASARTSKRLALSAA